MRFYLTDEYVEECKNGTGYMEEFDLIMLMSKHLDDSRKELFIDMLKQVEIDYLELALAMEKEGLPLDIHFSSDNGFEYAKFRTEEMADLLDTLVMYANLSSDNSIYLMFEELGPIFTIVSPSVLCKEFGDIIPFMIDEGVIELEFCHEDDDLNDDFAKNLINKTKEEQMDFISNYYEGEV